MPIDPRWLIAGFLAVSSWLTPQPKMSQGLLVIYGDDRLTLANAEYHWPGYALKDTGGCGMSAISPMMLGRLAYVSLDGTNWIGPCRIVDGVGQGDAADSIFVRHEVGEITWRQAARLGFTNGGRRGFVWFGACPPPNDYPPQPYVVEPKFTTVAFGGPAIFNGGYPDIESTTWCRGMQ